MRVYVPLWLGGTMVRRARFPGGRVEVGNGEEERTPLRAGRRNPPAPIGR